MVPSPIVTAGTKLGDDREMPAWSQCTLSQLPRDLFSDAVGHSTDGLVGDVRLRGLAADAHHGGNEVDMIGDVFAGHVLSDSQVVAVLQEPHQ